MNYNELSVGANSNQYSEVLAVLRMGNGRLKQYVVSTVCQLSVMLGGAAFSWFEPITSRLVKDPKLNLTADDLSCLVYFLTAGAAIGSLFAGDLTNRIGRKYVIMSIGPLCIAGWITFLWSKSKHSLILVRILQGLAVGVACTVPPIYSAEIAEPKLRGVLSGTFEIAWDIGNVYSLCLGAFLNYDMYAFACFSLPIIFIIIWMFIPESPYYLLMSKRPDEAKKVLEYFRDGDVEEEFQDMQNAVIEEMSNGGPWKTLFCDKVERRALIIVQIVSIAKYLTGLTVIKNYALDTVSKSDPSLSEEVMSILVAAVLTVIDLFAALLSDWVGRKPLLLTSCYGCFVAHFITGGYYYILNTSKTASDFTWMLYFGMAMYCIFSVIGVGALLQTLQSEMFGASTRGIAAGITEGSASFLSLLEIKLYSPIHETCRVYFNFWAYGLVSLVGGLLLSNLMYETAGRIIGQMIEKVIL